MTDVAQQCSVLQVISGDIDGITISSTGTHSCCAGSGVGSLRSFRFHKERCTVHLLLDAHFYRQNKYSCDDFL